ncbi:DUF948 domain-containing protein [Virgibacillus ihumii]|uniref:DUF948 domain-containing protein n=1 Tax=Virgibacillus ihumii TaxID=2686091 RepID=UPI00157BEB2B|nr:DUF948 domain-containing protein [Virgibacillus ihumii]
MDWIGIGVIIIGLAFLGLVFFLIKPLKNLTELFASLQKTTDELPDQVADITSETTSAISAGRDAINQVNKQMNELSPLFQLIGDMGNTTRGLSSSLIKVNTTMREKLENDSAIKRNNLEWIYGIMTLGYCIFQRNKASN